MSVLNILYIFFSWISRGKKILTGVKTTVALCRDQCLTELRTTQTYTAISAQRDSKPISIPLKGLLGFAFLLHKTSAGLKETSPGFFQLVL